MHEYKLPNNVVIDIEHLSEVVTSESEARHFFDCITGIVLHVPNNVSLGIWQAEIGDSKRYALLEIFNSTDYARHAHTFLATLLSSELSKKEISVVEKIIKGLGHDAFIEYLETKTDGWIYAWDQYIHDEAGEYVRDWLSNHPVVTITESFVGCGDCAICTARVMHDSAPPTAALLKAFQTEDVMQSVEDQLKKRATNVTSITRKPDKVVPEPKSAFVFKITLNYAKPPIWRRIVVPDNYTFYELHCAIQDAMGWLDCHLHSFTFDTSSKKEGKSKSRIDARQTIALPHPDAGMFDMGDIDETGASLDHWFGPTAKQCIYTYDFGDDWDHTVVLEKVLPFNNKQTYPECTGGKNACPPEDCGGVWGYENLKAVLADPKNEEHEDILVWLDLESAGEFKPEHFDPTEVEFDDPKERLQEWQDHTEM